MTERAPVITVDGPVGSGKGTIAQQLGRTLGWHILDSGALYRLLALRASRIDVDTREDEVLVSLAETLDVKFLVGARDEPVRVLLGGEDVSDEVRAERVGELASRLAGRPAVRQALLGLQRSFRRPPGLVADGRDLGTVVFPDAELKIFLGASVEERARRRYKQLIAKGIDVSLASLLAAMAQRDKRDSERATAPLKPAEDAVVIDTTNLSIAAVMQAIMAEAAGRGLVE